MSSVNDKQTCTICGKTVASVEAAIEARWIPDLLLGDGQEGVCCYGCCNEYARESDDGEMRLDPAFDLDQLRRGSTSNISLSYKATEQASTPIINQ